MDRSTRSFYLTVLIALLFAVVLFSACISDESTAAVVAYHRETISTLKAYWNNAATNPQCQYLPTTSNTFDIQVCPSIQPNSISVKIKETECDSDTEAPSDAPRPALGPHSFHIVLDGAARAVLAVPDSYDEYTCTYSFQLPINIQGQYKMRIKHTYSDWMAYRDHLAELPGQVYPGREYNKTLLKDGSTPRWPPLDNSRILRTPFDFHTSDFIAKFDIDSVTRMCSSRLPEEAVYPAAENAGRLPYSFVSRQCRLSESTNTLLTPINALDGPQKLVREGCLRSQNTSHPLRRIVFQGDSHIRMLYQNFVAVLAGDGRQPDYAKEQQQHTRIGDLDIIYQWDEQLQQFRDHPDSKHYDNDIWILSTGAHQAYWHVDCQTWIKEHLEHIARRIHWTQQSDARRGRTRQFVYMSSPAFPPNKDGVVQYNRDWRTNIRMNDWSELALNMFQNIERVSLIDGFALSLPFIEDTVDHSHYRDTPAMTAMISYLLQTIELCGSKAVDDDY